MSVEDAANAVVWWLCCQHSITVAAEVFGKELEDGCMRIGIVQVSPEPKRRIFEMTALDVADCYEVKEVA